MCIEKAVSEVPMTRLASMLPLHSKIIHLQPTTLNSWINLNNTAPHTFSGIVCYQLLCHIPFYRHSDNVHYSTLTVASPLEMAQ